MFQNDECTAFNYRKVVGTCWLVLNVPIAQLQFFDDVRLASFVRQECRVSSKHAQ